MSGNFLRVVPTPTHSTPHSQDTPCSPLPAQDLNSQIQEHIAVTPRDARVLGLGTHDDV